MPTPAQFGDDAQRRQIINRDIEMYLGSCHLRVVLGGHDDPDKEGTAVITSVVQLLDKNGKVILSGISDLKLSLVKL